MNLKKVGHTLSVKDNVLKYLEDNRGTYISGEQLADVLGVSRTSVWKAIKKLQEGGFSIDAVSNKGYMLMENSDILTESGVVSKLQYKDDIRLEVYDCVESTNLALKKRGDEKEGLVIAANAQTGGLGRLGRSFYSPTDSGIYFSILLKPQIETEEVTLLTSIAAVAVCEAIETCTGRQPSIKWVNDVFLNGKKVNGTLTQASFSMEDRKPEYVIVGIGINLYEPENGFGDELKDIAGFIEEQRIGNLKNDMLAVVLNRFFYYYKNFEAKEFIEEYRKRSFVIGKDINIISGNSTRKAKAIGIDDSCHLIVENEDGQTESVSSGEISIRLA